MDNIYKTLKTVLDGVEDLHGRIYPTAAPEGEPLPHCVYVQESREALEAVTDDVRMAWYTFRLNFAATSYGSVISVESAAKAALEGGLQAADPHVVGSVWAADDSEGYVPELNAQHRRPTIRILYEEDYS